MSRSQAKRSFDVQRLRGQLRDVRFDERLAAGLRDEAPGAYRDVGLVMRAQRELTRIVRELRARVSFKGV